MRKESTMRETEEAQIQLEHAINKYAMQQGWNEESESALVLRYLAYCVARKLIPSVEDFDEFLAEHAQWEKQESDKAMERCQE
jgi:hypothetical protein